MGGACSRLTTEMTDGAPETLFADQNGSAPFGPSNCSAAPGRGEHAGSRNKAESSRGEPQAALWFSRLRNLEAIMGATPKVQQNDKLTDAGPKTL